MQLALATKRRAGGPVFEVFLRGQHCSFAVCLWQRLSFGLISISCEICNRHCVCVEEIFSVTIAFWLRCLSLLRLRFCWGHLRFCARALLAWFLPCSIACIYFGVWMSNRANDCTFELHIVPCIYPVDHAACSWLQQVKVNGKEFGKAVRQSFGQQSTGRLSKSGADWALYVFFGCTLHFAMFFV